MERVGKQAVHASSRYDTRSFLERLRNAMKIPFLIAWGGVEPSPLLLRPLNDLLYQFLIMMMMMMSVQLAVE
jgi:hypothetical protein